MREAIIDDKKLLKYIEVEKMTQTAAAREFGVSRQAVSQRLEFLRGKATKIVVAKKLEKIVDHKIDTMKQLTKINHQANWLLDHVMAWIQGDKTALQVLETGVDEDQGEFAGKDPHEIALKAMAEIRGQMKIQLEIFQTLFDMKAVQQFQDTVLEAIGRASPEVRNAIIQKLNQQRSLNSTLRFS